MPLRAITFDFWRTLFRDANTQERQQVRVTALARATHLPEEKVADAFSFTWPELNRTHREEQRTLGAQDALRLTLVRLGATVEPHKAEQLVTVFAEAVLHHSPMPIEDALDAVRAAARRCPIGLVSDTGVSPGRVLRKLLDRHGFLEYFTVLAFSDEVRVSKPQRQMFATAAAALKVLPNELLHIGDIESTDIQGAKAFGAQAALFTGDNAEHANVTQADYTFGSWHEFIDVLPNLMNGSGNH